MLEDLNQNFIPLGVLLLSGLPRFPGPGFSAPDSWEWFDYTLADASTAQRKSLRPEIEALSFLVASNYIRLTYKILTIQEISLVCLRVYHVLKDIDGSSALAAKRATSKAHDSNRLKHLRYLFGVLNFSKHAWCGDFRDGGKIVSMIATQKRKEVTSDTIDLFIHHNDNSQPKGRTDNARSRLLQIYRSLESPTIHKERLDPEIQELTSIVERGAIPGIKTQLYKYQMQSICKMLQVETNPDYQHPPHILQLRSDINGRQYYINPTEYSFMKHPTYYASPKGGILAEDMGLGKSLICIALTAVTKFQCSHRPDDVFEEEYDVQEPENANLLSMLDYCATSIVKNNISWRMYTDRLPQSCVEKLKTVPSYYYTRPKHLNRALKQAELSPLRLSSRSSSRSTKSSYSTDMARQKVWISCATLIIVPSTLFDQWRNEIIKHADPGILSVFCLSKPKHQVPPPEKLLNFDIVLMSATRFSAEEKDKNSNLKSIHWKRLIIDEGHSTSLKSRLSYLAKDLYAERRWAVSGTPTPGLTRMSVDSTPNSKVIAGQFSEKQELEKLGSIMENFLMVEPWASSKGLWFKDIVSPFLKNTYRGTVNVQRVLHQLVVRHKEHDVTTDVVLPPLYRETVYIEPSFFNQLAINLFASVINVNAVTSEREDQDYLFHPASHVELKRLVSNLQSASFYWTGFSVEDLQSLYDISTLYLKKMEAVKDALKNSPSEAARLAGTSKRLLAMTDTEWNHDTDLLKSAMKTVDYVRHKKHWVNVSKSHEMCYFTNNLPTALHLRARATASQTQPLIMSEVSGLHESIMVASGSLLVEYKFQMGYFPIDLKLKAKLKSSVDEGLLLHGTDSKVKPSTPMAALSSTYKTKRKSSDKSEQNRSTLNNKGINGFIPTVSKFYDGLAEESADIVDDKDMLDEAFTPSRTPSPFAEGNECDHETCQLLGTSSAKLSYLVSRLISLTPTEKCIVFYEFDDVAYYIAEALDVIGMKYLIYSNNVSSSQRSRYLAEFHVNPSFRVLIMNVRLASHGLDVSTASRVFFMSPIWRNDIEAQAIKRAHRIGQRNPVYIETLVLNNTMEETVINSRKNQTLANEGDVSDNEVIRKFLLNHPRIDLDTIPNDKTSGMAALFDETKIEQESRTPVYMFRHADGTSNPQAPKSTAMSESAAQLKSALEVVRSAKRTRKAKAEGDSKKVKFST